MRFSCILILLSLLDRTIVTSFFIWTFSKSDNLFGSFTKLVRRSIYLIFRGSRAHSFFSWISVLLSFHSFVFSSIKLISHKGALVLHVNKHTLYIPVPIQYGYIYLSVLLAYPQFLWVIMIEATCIWHLLPKSWRLTRSVFLPVNLIFIIPWNPWDFNESFLLQQRHLFMVLNLLL